MKISLILGTYGSRLDEIDRLCKSLESQTYKNFEVLVGVQTNHDIVKDIFNKYTFNYKIFIDSGIGPSSSRNRAKNYATGDIYTFADDDGWYLEDTLERVVEFFNSDKEADIISFMHYDPILKKSTLDYSNTKIERLNLMQTLKLASLDVWYRSDSIDIKEHNFDERFGTGTIYGSGEENIFLVDIYNEGNKKISFYPEIMAYHPYKAVNYVDEKSIIGKGPLFKRLFGGFKGTFLFIAFMIKKRNIIKEHNDGKFFTIFIDAVREQKKFRP